jgi:hypothetical protein
MTPNEYTQALDKALSDLESRIQERDVLNAKIAGDRETVRVLASRIPLTKERREDVSRLLDMVDFATPTLANSIRAVLAKAYPNEMSAVDVRNALEESSFSFDDFSNSLSACHAALKRMEGDGDVEPIQRKDGKTAYRKVLKLSPVVLNALAPESGRWSSNRWKSRF